MVEVELAEVVVGADSRESPAARSAAASEFLSCLKLNEIYSMKGATAAEVEVVGTCVYYYLPEAGHDARSRIGSTTVFSSEALSQIGGARASCSVGRGRQECGHCLECGGV
jgi:hypothetical protein